MGASRCEHDGIQNFYVEEKLVNTPVTEAELSPPPWVDQARASISPFRLVHDDDRPGCR